MPCLETGGQVTLLLSGPLRDGDILSILYSQTSREDKGKGLYIN